jgi:hypothetical protein
MLPLISACSQDQFEGMTDEEKLKKYEKIKIEILQRWTCNYFLDEIENYTKGTSFRIITDGNCKKVDKKF